jgi:transposase
MTRTLRTWLSGDREVARDVIIPSVEQEDAKRIERERKYLVEERASIVARIKGLLALHGIWLTGKRIGQGLRGRLDTMRTGDGRPLAPFLRRDVERMLYHYDFVSRQLEEVVADRKQALAGKSEKGSATGDAWCRGRNDSDCARCGGLPSFVRNATTRGVVRRARAQSL